jgi:hypothetical protein
MSIKSYKLFTEGKSFNSDDYLFINDEINNILNIARDEDEDYDITMD